MVNWMKQAVFLLLFMVLIVSGTDAARAGDDDEQIYDYRAKRVMPDTPQNQYIYCRLKAAMDAKRDGLDTWAAEKAGKPICLANAYLGNDKTVSKYIKRTIDKYYEGE